MGAGLEGSSNHRNDCRAEYQAWAPGSGEESCTGRGAWCIFFCLFVQRALCKNSSRETGSPACQVQHRE